MPNNEVSRRRVLVAAVTLTGLYGAAGVEGIGWRKNQAAQRDREQVRKTLTPELLAQHGFMEIGPHGSPAIAPWGRDDLSGLIVATGGAHEAVAQGIIMDRPSVQQKLLLTTGRLELGLNAVSGPDDYGGIIPAVHGGVRVFIPEDDIRVAVRTEGPIPLSYALQKIRNGDGYVLDICGDSDVAGSALSQGLAALDGAPFLTDDVRKTLVTPFVAILPRSVQ